MTFWDKNFLDGLTQIDDLLMIQSALLQKIVKEQRITNQLLVILIQSIGQGQAIQVDGGTLTPLLSVNEEYKTFVFKRVNFSGDGVAFEKQVSGIISEMLFLSDASDSDNSDFSIKIISDNDVLVDATYTTLAAGNKYESDITAFDDDSYYVLSFKDIAFTSSIVVQIYNSNATFDKINIKYHQKVV